MNADRFTIKSQEALQAAISLAAARKHSQVAPEHLLAVLLEQEDGMTLPVLRKLGASPDAIRAQVNAEFDELPTLSTEAEPTTAPELMQVIRASESLKGLDWFEMTGVRGLVKDGKVNQFQVTVKVGFRIMSEQEIRGA